MTVPHARSRIVRFGAFEFDSERGELRKHGSRIKLNGQPVQLLAALTERPGELVTREELEKRLWPADTHVDFEHSLNAAVKRLRMALGDSADSPFFVETIARKGYRFIAPLDVPPSEETAGRKTTRDIVTTVPRKATRWRTAFLCCGASLVFLCGAGLWLRNAGYFWENPIAGAQFLPVTDFDGVEQAAALSRDGNFVAFLSDRGGQVDVWVTQAGSGEFHNLTQGRVAALANASVRTVGFSPDGSLVTYWTRKQSGADSGRISVWAVPTLGGEPRPYLEDAAEFDWSEDGSRLAYHTPGPGDPLYVSDSKLRPEARIILTAPPGLHSHFPLWAADSAFIYFVRGSLPDKLDIWRILPSGGTPERITGHSGRVTHPVLFGRRTLLYLASDSDGTGPWLYSIDVERRIPHRLTSGFDSYTSLSASANGNRLVATRTNTKRTLWRLKIGNSPDGQEPPSRISLSSNTGFSPRLGPNYLLYLSAKGKSESIWREAPGSARELWSGTGVHILGAPAITPDGQQVAFCFEQRGKKFLEVMNADGTGVRVVSNSLNVQDTLAWAPDQRSITAAVEDYGTPRLFRVPVDGRSPTPFVSQYSVYPAWAPGGDFAVYSGPDIGTTFTVKAISTAGYPHPFPPLNLTRGARHVAFLPDGHALLFLKGDLQHKDLWAMDLETGAQRQLTRLGADFDIRDFDISPDGKNVVLERAQGRSDVVLIQLPRRSGL